jgi:uncharacterized membrane protein YoaK (UPF0700 family)
MTHEGEHRLWHSLHGLFRSDGDLGTLPALLLTITLTTGIVDATSVLGLGRVFVGNMTGNVVFVGLALARAPDFSIVLTVTSLVGFVVGASIGGVTGRRFPNRGASLRSSCIAQVILVTIAATLCIPDAHHLSRPTEIVIIALLAVAMGIRNSMTRWLAVPGLVTNVLTSTLTSMAADQGTRSRPDGHLQIFSVGSVLLGALLGAELVIHWSILASLAAVVVLLLVVIVSIEYSNRNGHPWLDQAP